MVAQLKQVPVPWFTLYLLHKLWSNCHIGLVKQIEVLHIQKIRLSKNLHF